MSTCSRQRASGLWFQSCSAQACICSRTVMDRQQERDDDESAELNTGAPDHRRMLPDKRPRIDSDYTRVVGLSSARRIANPNIRQRRPTLIGGMLQFVAAGDIIRSSSAAFHCRCHQHHFAPYLMHIDRNGGFLARQALMSPPEEIVLFSIRFW